MPDIHDCLRQTYGELPVERKPKDGVSITIKFDAEKFVAEFMAKLDAMAKEAADEMYREMKRRLDEEGLE